jgi:hypothetical protein
VRHFHAIGTRCEPQASMTDPPRHPDDRKSAADRIPGERDPGTALPRQPGAIGGRFSGADTPSPDARDIMDEATIEDRKIEGGGTR